jgi:hypothetical protein
LFLAKEGYNLYVCRCAGLATGENDVACKMGRIAAIVCVLPVLLVGPAPGKDDASWKVKPDVTGKDDEPSEDVSGIACTTSKAFRALA